jgi:NTE family protein
VNFEQFRSSAFFVDTLKQRHTLMAGIRYSTTVDGTAPVQSLVRAGGLFNMSGFEPNELTGQHYGLGLLGYRFRLKDRPILPPSIGATLEYGNAANNRDDIIDNGIWNGSLYAGFASPIGPIYAGYGWREHDSGVIFVRIGTIFTNAQSR